MPTANITTINAIATIPFTISFIFGAFFKIIPRITATPINNMETVAAAPLAYTALPSSFLTDAYRAPKSCTAPKNNPPTTIHKNTGTHPNTLARIGPVTGPAPAIDEN